MTGKDFKNIGKITLDGKRKTLYEHRHIAMFKCAGHNIPAKTREEAIEKLRECAARKGKDNGSN